MSIQPQDITVANMPSGNTVMPHNASHKTNTKFKTFVLIAGGLLASELLIISVCTERIPPDALTRNRMRVIQRRIIDYYATNGMPPASLEDLPPSSPDIDDLTTDAWGNDIGYRLDGDTVVLQSMGQDAVRGGSGMDQDIYLSFKPSKSEMFEEFAKSQPVRTESE